MRKYISYAAPKLSIAEIKINSPAKLNLYLSIIAKKKHYHSLHTLFQLIDCVDNLTIRTHRHAAIQVHCKSNPIIQDNLVKRAAYLLQAYANISYGAEIELIKHIPIGAGLGGGSSNAATVLYVLNHLWGIHASRQTLESLAKQLGADVPFFLYRQSAFATGRGDIIHPVSLPPKDYLIVYPGIFLSTKEIFRQYDLHTYPHHYPNDLLPVVLRHYPQFKQAFHDLWEISGQKPQLTGTGSALFIPVSFQKGVILSQKLYNRNVNYRILMCHGINRYGWGVAKRQGTGF